MKKTILTFVVGVMTVMTAKAVDAEGRVVVAADGTGDYATLSDAVRKVRGDFDEPTVIYVKNGVYKEKVVINATVNNLTIEGESAEGVVITYGDYASLNNMGTSGSYTMKIEGNNVTLRNVTIENSAGPVGPAVAMHTIGDRITFVNCRFLGNQDTLYTGGRNARLFFDECYVEGTTDFIFGSATALFRHCLIHGKANSFITAASTARENPVGYVFADCTVTSAEGVDRLYLGRPWRPYASTAFIGCTLPASICPEGWNNWGNAANEKTARYAEYGSKGEGASPETRAKWTTTLSEGEAAWLTDPAMIFTRALTWDCRSL